MKLKVENPPLEWQGFKGLNIQPDVLLRPYDSFQVLQNVDMFIPGSLRKIVGPLKLGGPYGAPIVEMLTYRQLPSTPLIDIGVGTDGNLYDLIQNVRLASLGVLPGQPFVCLFPGTGLPTNSAISYLLALCANAQPLKFDGVSVTQIGCSSPLTALSLSYLQSAYVANAYFMQVGIQYAWTYFNPQTLHESSPSPVENSSIITPTTNTPALATPYITQVELQIPTIPPAIGSGYTRIRVYRTRDGGATFFLLPMVYDVNGNDLSDSNDSVLIQGNTTTVYDGLAAKNIAPTDDSLLVNPPQGAPTIGANNPPPFGAVWGAVYQSRMWYLAPDLKTLWFSNIGDFQSVGIYNYFSFATQILDQLTAMIALSDRLIINGQNSSWQITGTDFTSFVLVPIDMRRGAVGRRAAVTDGDNIYVLTRQSLARMAFAKQGPPFIGDQIKPLTDSIQKASYQSIINADIDTTRSILFFAVKINGAKYCDQVILADLGKESPFSVITGLPTEIITVRELEFADGSTDIVFSGADGNVYRFYDNTGGDGSLVASIMSQQLPQDDSYDLWKTWQHFVPIGTDLSNWVISFSVDGGNTFTAPRPLFTKTPIGLSGKQIIWLLMHYVNNGKAALLSRAKLKSELKMGAQ